MAQSSLLKSEAEKLSGEARGVLASAHFDGVNWIAYSNTAGVQQELIGAKAAVETASGLNITGRGMIFRFHLSTGRYRPMAWSP